MLDLHVPGMAGHFLRASHERRQVISAYLSTIPRRDSDAIRLPNDDVDVIELAGRLMAEDHQTLLIRAFGQLPAGFRGALRRSGPQPHAPRYYRLLHHLLSHQRRPEIAKAIHRLAKIDMNRLTIICVLPPELLHPELISSLRDRSNAREVVVSVNLLREAALNADAFATGLRMLRQHGEVRKYVEKWILKCSFAPSPVAASDRYAPIIDGEALTQKALEYRNCSRDYALDLLEGTASLGEFTSPAGRVLVMLVNRDGQWLLDDVYARRNTNVGDRIRSQAIDYLRLQGIVERRVARRKETPFRTLRRLLPRAGWM